MHVIIYHMTLYKFLKKETCIINLNNFYKKHNFLFLKICVMLHDTCLNTMCKLKYFLYKNIFDYNIIF